MDRSERREAALPLLFLVRLPSGAGEAQVCQTATRGTEREEARGQE